MHQINYLVLMLILLLLGCSNVSESVKDGIKNNVNEVMEGLKDSALSGKVNFGKSYHAVLNKGGDSSSIMKIEVLHNSMTTTVNFIDTLIYEVGKFDNDDVSNVQVIRTIFINRGKGDSLYRCLNTLYRNALDNATNATVKSEIIKSRDNALGNLDANQYSTMLFSVNSPLGVIMMLYGSEIELLHVGQNSLEN
jgi:hypothetical protein